MNFFANKFGDPIFERSKNLIELKTEKVLQQIGSREQ